MTGIDPIRMKHDFLVRFDPLNSISTDQIQKLQSLFPKDFPGATSSVQVQVNGENKSHLEIFLKTYPTSRQLVIHYLGLDTYENKEVVNLIVDAYINESDTLDLRDKRITSLPESIAHLSPYLKTLILTGNKLKTLPNEIGHLRELKILRADQNELVSFPSITHLDALEELDLSHNKLTALPNPLFRSFKEALGESPTRAFRRERLSLNFGYNWLEELPMDIYGMTCLKSLNVQCNKINDWPDVELDVEYFNSLDNPRPDNFG